jgi:hypothetical protein
MLIFPLIPDSSSSASVATNGSVTMDYGIEPVTATDDIDTAMHLGTSCPRRPDVSGNDPRATAGHRGAKFACVLSDRDLADATTQTAEYEQENIS